MISPNEHEAPPPPPHIDPLAALTERVLELERSMLRTGSLASALNDALAEHLAKIEGGTQGEKREQLFRMALVYVNRNLRRIAEADPQLAARIDDRTDAEKAAGDEDLPKEP